MVMLSFVHALVVVIGNLRIRSILPYSRIWPLHIIHEPHIGNLLLNLLNFSFLHNKLQFQVLPMARLIDPLIYQMRFDDINGLEHLINEVLEKIIMIHI